MKNLLIIICLLVLTSSCATSGNQQDIYDAIGVVRNDIAVLQLMIINMDKYQPTGFVGEIGFVDAIWDAETDQTVFVDSPVVEITTSPFPEEDTITAPSTRWLDWKIAPGDTEFGLRDDGVVVWRDKK